MKRRSRYSGSSGRRGATLVLVAVMIIVTGGMAALAIDFARVYSGVTELQSGSDAAALAGVQRLRLNPGLSVVSHVQTFATNNRAFGTAISLATSDVQGGIYNPTTRVFTAGAWSTANAVRVTSARTTSSGFARLVGLGVLNPRRSAVAWIGNQAAADCLKPFGINATYLNTLVGQNITTSAGVAALRTLASTTAGRQSLTVVAGPDVNGNRPGRAPATVFSAMTFAGNSGNNTYQNAITGNYCNDGRADLTVGATEQIQPGNGLGDVPRATADAIEAVTRTCRVRTSTTDATCYDPVAPGNVEGVTITVATVSSLSSNSVRVESVVGFRLMCVFRGGTGNGNNNAASTSETCPWLTAAGRDANNYLRGTLVGYPVITTARTGIGNSLGNTIGPAQKLVLVQ
jgi:hypothetical protein